MKKNFLLFIPIVLITVYSIAQENTNYNSEWKKVESFELEHLPKSALTIVDGIYQKAKKENNASQITKALIYKSKFALILEENARLNIIDSFKIEIANSTFPTKNILESVLANLYWQYFQQNRYQFYNRTQTKSKVDETDFRTWDLKTLFFEIHLHFQNSLQNGLECQLTDLTEFDDILNTQKDSKKYRPTLYDFLSYNALDFYKSNQNAIINPAYKFEIDNPDYLSDYNTFSKIDLLSKDSLSLQLNALIIYQKLINFHKKKGNSALISADLERLNFVKENAIFNEVDSLQLNALNYLKSQFSSNETSTLVDFEIATIYNNQANQFIAGINSKYQFNRVKALEICNSAIEKFPLSFGTTKCEQLKEQIKSSELTITSESNVPLDLYSKVLIRYKNLDALYFNVYPISIAEQTKFNNIYNEADRIYFIKHLQLSQSFQQKLITENDFQNHTTEIAIPPLKNGQYLVVVSPNKTLQKDALFASTYIQATNIAVSEIKINNENIYQIIDRNTGKPIANAQVNLKNTNIGQYNKYINENFITDSKGQLNFQSSSSHRNVVITVKTANEIAYFNNYYVYNSRNRFEAKEKAQIKPFLFTDRSIYRPGQTVYFKGIFIEDKKGISNLFINENTKVTLFNANNEEVKTIDLITNEYGSVSGEFILPNNGLLGQYAIKLEAIGAQSSYFYFSVEEYKRPKFETSFKPITETYQLNDSVTVNGTAMAFSGSSISNAKVVYRVHRQVQYPRWFYWSKPNFSMGEGQEITNGETVTNDEGNYTITFKALPDSNVNKDNLPIFTYEIVADVTDINGETRSATTLVKVGYHSLIAEINMSETLDKNSDENTISIETKNLNNQILTQPEQLKYTNYKHPKMY